MLSIAVCQGVARDPREKYKDAWNSAGRTPGRPTVLLLSDMSQIPPGLPLSSVHLKGVYVYS